MTDLSLVALILLAAFLHAAWNFVDAQGVRSADDPFDFIVWALFLDSLPIAVAAWWWRRGRIRAFVRGNLGRGLGLDGHGRLRHRPVGHVPDHHGQCRRPGIFAALFGTLILGEPFGRRRLLAATGVAAGIVLLQAGG